MAKDGEQQFIQRASQPPFVVETVFESVQVDVSVNQYRLELILNEVQGNRDRPQYDDAWPWVGVVLAFLLALLPTDFQDYLGIEGAVWEALALFGTFGSGFLVLRTVYRAWKHRKDEMRTTKQIVAELVAEMRESQEPEHTHTPSFPMRRVPDTQGDQSASTE
ncbi:MAG: hypothetical protein O2783_03460 [Chloroflexi bacterium]|nr:hypothetical protein [Chloroflexota bacterium]